MNGGSKRDESSAQELRGLNVELLLRSLRARVEELFLRAVVLLFGVAGVGYLGTRAAFDLSFSSSSISIALRILLAILSLVAIGRLALLAVSRAKQRSGFPKFLDSKLELKERVITLDSVELSDDQRRFVSSQVATAIGELPKSELVSRGLDWGEWLAIGMICLVLGAAAIRDASQPGSGVLNRLEQLSESDELSEEAKEALSAVLEAAQNGDPDLGSKIDSAISAVQASQTQDKGGSQSSSSGPAPTAAPTGAAGSESSASESSSSASTGKSSSAEGSSSKGDSSGGSQSSKGKEEQQSGSGESQGSSTKSGAGSSGSGDGSSGSKQSAGAGSGGSQSDKQGAGAGESGSQKSGSSSVGSASGDGKQAGGQQSGAQDNQSGSQGSAQSAGSQSGGSQSAGSQSANDPSAKQEALELLSQMKDASKGDNSSGSGSQQSSGGNQQSMNNSSTGSEKSKGNSSAGGKKQGDGSSQQNSSTNDQSSAGAGDGMKGGGSSNRSAKRFDDGPGGEEFDNDAKFEERSIAPKDEKLYERFTSGAGERGLDESGKPLRAPSIGEIERAKPKMLDDQNAQRVPQEYKGIFKD